MYSLSISIDTVIITVVVGDFAVRGVAHVANDTVGVTMPSQLAHTAIDDYTSMGDSAGCVVAHRNSVPVHVCMLLNDSATTIRCSRSYQCFNGLCVMVVSE